MTDEREKGVVEVAVELLWMRIAVGCPAHGVAWIIRYLGLLCISGADVFLKAEHEKSEWSIKAHLRVMLVELSIFTVRSFRNRITIMEQAWLKYAWISYHVNVVAAREFCQSNNAENRVLTFDKTWICALFEFWNETNESIDVMLHDNILIDQKRSSIESCNSSNHDAESFSNESPSASITKLKKTLNLSFRNPFHWQISDKSI